MKKRSLLSWSLLTLLLWSLLLQEWGQAGVGRPSEPFSTELEDMRQRWLQELGDTRQRWLQEMESLRQWWDQEITRVGSEYGRQATIDWDEYRKQIDRVWDTFRRTTAKTWADYSDDTSARTVVDFEQGTIDVEVVVPSAAPNAAERGADRVKGKFLETFAKQDRPERPALESQLRTQDGQVVTPQNVEQFAETEVKGSAQQEKPFRSQDGVERLKVTARLRMAHDHAHHLATRYVPLATTFGLPRQIPPARVLAVIHTESAFNPYARSSEGAIGLMQLIPHLAARDAYGALYGEPKTVSMDYLYNPVNNANLGTVYVTLLRDRHLGYVQDPITRDYLVICAYNWGIGKIKRLIRQPNHLSREEVLAILRNRTPQETRKYLERILRRTMLYEPMGAER